MEEILQKIQEAYDLANNLQRASLQLPYTPVKIAALIDDYENVKRHLVEAGLKVANTMKADYRVKKKFPILNRD